MPEKATIETTVGFWADKHLYISMAVFMSVVLAYRLVGNEPINLRRLIGELILALVGAGVFHALGLLKGLSGPEYWLMIFLAAMGGLRSIEWSLKVFIALKKVSL